MADLQLSGDESANILGECRPHQLRSKLFCFIVVRKIKWNLLSSFLQTDQYPALCAAVSVCVHICSHTRSHTHMYVFICASSFHSQSGRQCEEFNEILCAMTCAYVELYGRREFLWCSTAWLCTGAFEHNTCTRFDMSRGAIKRWAFRLAVHKNWKRRVSLIEFTIISVYNCRFDRNECSYN